MDTQQAPPQTKQALAVRKGDIIVISDRWGVDHPCQVVGRSISKLKNAGHIRVLLSGLDIFTGRKYEAFYGNSSRFTNVITPTVNCYDVELVDMDSNSLIAIDSSGELVEGLTILSDELRETVKRAFEAGEEDLWLGVVCCLGQKVITALHGKHDDLFLNAQPTD